MFDIFWCISFSQIPHVCPINALFSGRTTHQWAMCMLQIANYIQLPFTVEIAISNCCYCCCSNQCDVAHFNCRCCSSFLTTKNLENACLNKMIRCKLFCANIFSKLFFFVYILLFLLFMIEIEFSEKKTTTYLYD